MVWKYWVNNTQSISRTIIAHTYRWYGGDGKEIRVSKEYIERHFQILERNAVSKNNNEEIIHESIEFSSVVM